MATDLTEKLNSLEVCLSIQGESSFVGRPCVFVRPTGRQMHCIWCEAESNATELAGWILADRLPVRLGLQLHKLLWGPGTRGV